mgnify:CR=1 FL=1
MSKIIASYLKKRAQHTHWPMTSRGQDGVEMVVVIPVLAESERLFLTLGDLVQNDPECLAHTSVMCVVNNRAPEIAGADDCRDNQRILAALPNFAAAHPTLRLAWVDASSPGRELGPKEGVGLARKIGLDWGLQILHENNVPQGPLISLDGDTRVGNDYLAAIRSFFESPTGWAAVVDYAHPTAGDSDETRAILAYEFFLRYQELALHYAQSPYHYPAIGSTMICTAEAYSASGGMNRRQAGEDFYFLQQLAKTGQVDRIRDTTVVPASRPSHRVPFGTGRKVGAYAQDEDDAYLIYNPTTYDVIRRWLHTAQGGLAHGGAALLEQAQAIDPELGRFLEQQQFETAWDRVLGQCKSDGQRQRQFHAWFDGFRTLKLTHHLRDHGHPRQDLFEALAVLLELQGIKTPQRPTSALRHDLDGQRALLDILRGHRLDPLDSI